MRYTLDGKPLQIIGLMASTRTLAVRWRVMLRPGPLDPSIS